MNRISAAAIVLVLVAGCGTLEGPRTGKIAPPTDALALWQDFPADQVPRPIVLFASQSPGQGFDTNDGKIASICAKFALATSLLVDAPKQADASWAGGTKIAYPAITPAEAFAALSRSGNLSTNPGCSTVAPLPVTAARLGIAGFSTDRGMAQMSAWLFKATGAHAEFEQPAIAVSAFWKGGPQEPSAGSSAIMGTNGRVLIFNFVGGPTDGPCAVAYMGVVAESLHAVAVGIQSNPGRPQAGPITCDLVGYLRTVTITLASPLGGRVLVDASGAAVAVSPQPGL